MRDEPEVPEGTWQSLLDEERARDAARQRGHRRHLREIDVAEAGLLGTLWDLAEARANVVVHTTSGRSVQGALSAVGADFCTIASANRLTHVPLRAVATLRPDPATLHAQASGVRERPTDVPLRDVVAELAAERPLVTLVVAGLDNPVTGVLTAAGRDVLTVRHARASAPVYVSLDAVLEVVVLGSG